MGLTNNSCRFQDLHFDQFPTPATFGCWKIRFKTEVCTCSQFPTEVLHWIREVEMVDSVDELRSSSSTRGISRPNFEVLDARIAYNTRLKRKVSLEEQKKLRNRTFLAWKTDCSPDLRILPGHWSQRVCRILSWESSLKGGFAGTPSSHGQWVVWYGCRKAVTAGGLYSWQDKALPRSWFCGLDLIFSWGKWELHPRLAACVNFNDPQIWWWLHLCDNCLWASVHLSRIHTLFQSWERVVLCRSLVYHCLGYWGGQILCTFVEDVVKSLTR